MSPLDPEVPPVGEEVHLPGPTMIPLFVGVGTTLMVVGITLGAVFWIPGVIITLLSCIRWVADTRRDIAELPAEHHSGGHHH